MFFSIGQKQMHLTIYKLFIYLRSPYTEIKAHIAISYTLKNVFYYSLGSGFGFVWGGVIGAVTGK